MDGLPSSAFGRPQERIVRASDVGRLALQLAMAREPGRVQPAVVDRGLDGAAGFAVVTAVPEPAALRQVRDVRECVLEAVGRAGDAERPDAWGVDEQRACRQADELAMGRRVPAARVVLANGARALAVVAQERVDERRLADARRAEDDRRPAGRQVVAGQRGDAVAGEGGDRSGPRRPGRPPRRRPAGPRDRRDIGLVEDDDGCRATGPRDREVALEAAEVEVAVEPGDDERHVDVGGQDLLVGEPAAGPPTGAGIAARTRSGGAGRPG